jgi:hypothetical protein
VYRHYDEDADQGSAAGDDEEMLSRAFAPLFAVRQ